ncbi:TonB-linked SusC/RagA family outer membrane protein [Chitinophaga terrae (ex Kim and Jung 2007)]|uniref:SusC/RagA family TonB-linked outer membrane protein n=1 Tax=Chitinophaga terrae (ex Kim and Jung 2007) TaxID=408074 RepID=UPI00278A22D8|nr:TonB-dependent receptor [Chitinophaga terrae (ex Kim and Jung 2007)]MDQ0109536.1 TonB-linked SusC/RagA family outer membrane protein [Chitinophaga terrae (ex Kim and Jung 2007)]
MKLSLMLAMLLLGLFASAQQRITGTVIHKETNIPLVGVSVQSKNQTAITDSSGHYSISARAGENIVFSFVGMKTQILVAPASGNLNVTLESNLSDLNQVVVTGYQTQKKADLTGAVSVVDLKQVKDVPLGNPVKALQGRIPGVFITTDGSPASGATVRIRGIGTLGNNNPLYVIDGIPTERGLNEINPADIESMQVLKDASSATIYGSRAANGVIIITTKKGKKGATRIDFNSSLSTQSYQTKLSVLNTEERGRALWQAAINDGVDPNTASPIYQFQTGSQNGKPVLEKVILPQYIDAAKTMKPADTKWFDEISQVSLIKNNDLTVSSGTEKSNSLFSVGYYDNTGIVKGSSLKRLTARINTEYRMLNDKLTIGQNFMGTFSTGTLVPAEDIVNLALLSQPIVPVHTISGGWGGPAPGMTDRHNPVRLIEDNRQNKSRFYRVFGNAYANLQVLPVLTLRSSIGIDYAGTYQRTIRKSYTSGFLSDPSNQVNTSQDYSGNWVWQNTLDFTKNINKHSINVLAGSELIKYMSQNFFGSRQGYALETIDYAYLNAGSSNKDNGGSGAANSLFSFFGKVNYVYDTRYLLSAIVRRDGSSRFGSENRFATFPAVSAGWRLSEESFIKNSQSFISDLKLRYGWGITGNQSIADNAIYDLYSAIYGTDPTWDRDRGSAYDINGGNSGQLPAGFTKTQRGNKFLKWESTTQSNFGIDYGFFDQKLSGSIDYFIKKTSDILLTPPSLAVIGEGGDPTVNGASMVNKGFEGVVNYDGKIGDQVSFSLSFNIATYRNRITRLPENSLTAFPGNGNDKVIINRSVNSFYGYVADGIFQNKEEVDNSPAQNGKGIGRIRYKDMNGDGMINGDDRDYIGTADPDFTYGFNAAFSWKHFDLSFFFQGVKGVMVNNGTKIYTDFSSLWPGTNWGSRTLNAWTPDNPSSTIPALTLVNRNDEGRFSTYYLEPGSYLRLRNVQIGYDLSYLSNRIHIKRAKAYLQSSNLLTFKSKKFTGPDPEAPNSTYPIPVIWTFGLNLSL